VANFHSGSNHLHFQMGGQGHFFCICKGKGDKTLANAKMVQLMVIKKGLGLFVDLIKCYSDYNEM